MICNVFIVCTYIHTVLFYIIRTYGSLHTCVVCGVCDAQSSFVHVLYIPTCAAESRFTKDSG